MAGTAQSASPTGTRQPPHAAAHPDLELARHELLHAVPAEHDEAKHRQRRAHEAAAVPRLAGRHFVGAANAAAAHHGARARCCVSSYAAPLLTVPLPSVSCVRAPVLLLPLGFSGGGQGYRTAYPVSSRARARRPTRRGPRQTNAAAALVRSTQRGRLNQVYRGKALWRRA